MERVVDLHAANILILLSLWSLFGLVWFTKPCGNRHTFHQHQPAQTYPPPNLRLPHWLHAGYKSCPPSSLPQKIGPKPSITSPSILVHPTQQI